MAKLDCWSGSLPRAPAAVDDKARTKEVKDLKTNAKKEGGGWKSYLVGGAVLGRAYLTNKLNYILVILHDDCVVHMSKIAPSWHRVLEDT